MKRTGILSSFAAAIATVTLAAQHSSCTAYSFQRLPKSTPISNEAVVSSRRTFFQTSSTAAAAAVSLVLTQQLQPANAEVTASTNVLTVGTKAPAFQLPNSRGEGKTSLADLTASKKWTVLYFYPGAFTSGCTLEARGFQRDIEKYRALNAQIVGVSVDSVEKNAQFCTSEGLDFYMLTDAGGVVSKTYGSALSVPGFGTFSNRQTYLIDPKGNLRWVFMDVESHVPRHSAQVLEKLAELQESA